MTRLARVLIIGTGSIGERHVRCFQRTGRAEVAICETRGPVREQVASQYRLGRSYENLDTALEETFDAAVICTPAHLHIPMAIRLARAGIHLLIEKPLSTSLEGLPELHRIVQQCGLRVDVAYVYRAHPALVAMRRALAAGRWGRFVQIVATCGQHFPTYRPAYREIYYTDRATGGGAVQDALTHVMNAAEWLIGPVDRLVADVAHQVLEGVDVEDTVHVMARHGEVMGCYSLNQYQAPNEVTITVVCEGGTARYEAHHSRWRWMIQPGDPWTDEPIGELDRDGLFVLQADRFLDFLEGKVAASCSLSEAEQTLRVNLAILASCASGRWEPIARGD